MEWRLGYFSHSTFCSIKKKVIKCARKNVTSVEFRAAVDFNVGEEVDTSVVARYFYYRHELTHTCIMAARNLFSNCTRRYTKEDTSLATCGHKGKEDSDSRDVCHGVNKRHQAFCSQEIQNIISRSARTGSV